MGTCSTGLGPGAQPASSTSASSLTPADERRRQLRPHRGQVRAALDGPQRDVTAIGAAGERLHRGLRAREPALEVEGAAIARRRATAVARSPARHHLLRADVAPRARPQRRAAVELHDVVGRAVELQHPHRPRPRAGERCHVFRARERRDVRHLVQLAREPVREEAAVGVPDEDDPLRVHRPARADVADQPAHVADVVDRVAEEVAARGVAGAPEGRARIVDGAGRRREQHVTAFHQRVEPEVGRLQLTRRAVAVEHHHQRQRAARAAIGHVQPHRSRASELRRGRGVELARRWRARIGLRSRCTGSEEQRQRDGPRAHAPV